MPRVLLQQVEQDPLQRRRVSAVPPLAGGAEVVQSVRTHVARVRSAWAARAVR